MMFFSDEIKKKLKFIGRIVLIAVCGAVLFFGAKEVFQLYKNFYDKEENEILLSQDLTIAQDFGKAADSKLKTINAEYKRLLKAYDAKITAYAELQAKYTSTYKALVRLQSSIPDTTPTSVPCPVGGQCTREICLPLFEGEQFKYDYEDDRLTLKLAFTRIGAEWEADIFNDIHLRFRLTLLETMSLKTGKKNLQAKLYEINKKGEEVKQVEISDFKYTTEDNTKFGMIWWSPTLKLGIYQPIFSKTTWYPKPFIAVSFSKWARPGHIDMWHFFQVGIAMDADSKALFLITPASYNLGNKIPLIKDLWLSIDYGIDIKARSTVGVSISTTL